jgi:excisionase family DNA binding protein
MENKIMTLLTHTISQTQTRKPTMPDLSEFMTTQEAAEKLGYSVGSIRNMVYQKKLDGIRFGRSLLIPKKAVKDYLEQTKGMNKHDPRRKIK